MLFSNFKIEGGFSFEPATCLEKKFLEFIRSKRSRLKISFTSVTLPPQHCPKFGPRGTVFKYSPSKLFLVAWNSKAPPPMVPCWPPSQISISVPVSLGTEPFVSTITVRQTLP